MTLIRPFNSSYPVTQTWGVNPDTYAWLGLKGHNGVDYGTPTGTIMIAPHGGTVLEVADDPKGYGLYIKIENDVEGSILAHLSRQDVKVGDTVSQGQQVGLSGNSGWSTGPHLHWGYYRKPRNKSDGFSGTINPFSYLSEQREDEKPDAPPQSWPEKDKHDALIRSFTAFNDQGRTNYYSDDPARLTADIIAREETIEDLRLELRDKEQEYTQKQKELQLQLEHIQKELDQERDKVIEAQKDLTRTKDTLSTLQGTLLECEHKIEEMATNTEKDEEILTLRGDIVQLQAENEMIRRVSLYGLIDWVKSLKLK